MNIQLPSYVSTAIKMLSEEGHEAYIVGGCVRDAFLDKTPDDWDITTSAKPEETQKVFSDFRTIETGLKHGTVTVIIEGEMLEITTMRVDGEYSDNRHPDSVDFTNRIELDLARRDFTVNAMAYNPETGLCDPFGGRSDLENGIIRCVGDPDKRFNEDALRIFRGIRFASVLDFEVEEKTAESALRNRKLLDNVAAERKRVELVKLLCGRDVRKILLSFPQIIFQIIPELEPMYKFPQNTPYHIYDVWEHTVEAVSLTPCEPLYRVAMLLHDSGKPQAFFADSDGTAHFKGHQSISYELSLKILSDLRFSKADTDTISKLILYHDVRPTGEKTDTLLWASRLGADFMKKLYPVFIADAKAQNPEFLPEKLEQLRISEAHLDEAIRNGTCLSIKELAVNGRDISAAGYHGAEIGDILSFLLIEVIKEKVENTKEKLLEYVKTHCE